MGPAPIMRCKNKKNWIIFSPLKIALIHTRLLRRGGLESRLFSYMEYFRAQGHDVTVFVYKVGAGMTVPQGVRLHHVKLGITPKVFRAWAFDRKLQRIVPEGGFDLVVSLGRTTTHDCMIVAGNHLGFMEAVGRKMRGLSDRMQIMMDDRAYKAPGVLLAASEMVKDQMIQHHETDPDKIQVLYPPTDPECFHQGLKAQKAAYRKEFGLPEDKQLFLFPSSNHKLKGLPIFLEVFREMQDKPVELVVMGSQPVQTDLPNVRYLGFVKETERVFAAGDYTLLASRYDAFGQTVTESLLCGTPAIVSGMTGAKAIVGPNEGIVVDSFTPKAWKAALLQAMDTEFAIDPQLAQHQGLLFTQHMQRILDCAGAGITMRS